MTSSRADDVSGAAGVVVVGGGNAGLCAAVAAAEAGARVVLLDKAGADWAGGNSAFTAGAFRTTFDGLKDVGRLVGELPADRAGRIDLSPYTPADFRADLDRVTLGRTDPLLADLLVREARPALDWLAAHGVRFELMFHRQAYEVDGRYRFWGGLAVGSVGGGRGLIERELEMARRAGVEIRLGAAALRLRQDPAGRICGVTVATGGALEELPAGAVVLCSGGFEANPQMRAAYLGPGWDLAAVRGTPHNTGDGHLMAMELRAQPWGHWSGCHSVAWDARAGMFGDRELTNQLTRNSYPVGVMVNRHGQRFVDEGADFRNYTYARIGAEILRQPGGVAYQVFDATSVPLLRPEEYQSRGATRVDAESIPALAEALGIDPPALTATIEEFNDGAGDEPFDPTVRDGKRTTGVRPPKSNWSLRIDTPPFTAFPVTCGITFTFGGLHVDEAARVLDVGGRPLPGLHAAGEIVGGLFHHNYPGGSGLTMGTVLGRVAGASAARYALELGGTQPRAEEAEV